MFYKVISGVCLFPWLNDIKFLSAAVLSREVTIYFYLRDIQRNGGEGPRVSPPVYDEIKLAQIRNK